MVYFFFMVLGFELRAYTFEPLHRHPAQMVYVWNSVQPLVCSNHVDPWPGPVLVTPKLPCSPCVLHRVGRAILHILEQF
jgi:hypothetical protein